MKKIIIQSIILLATFFGTWLALSQFDFMTRFEIHQKEQKLEEKLGEFVWESISESEQVLTDTAIHEPIRKIIDKICDANNINKAKIKPHIIYKSEINAFALPDGHLVINTELIKFADESEEVAGVIAHEIAHIERNHVMKKLIKEFGFAVLANMMQGGETLFSVNRYLTSSAYDRSLEIEADEYGAQYLIEAKIDPEGLSNFLYKVSKEMPEIPDVVYWINSHPESEKRARNIINSIPDTKMNFEAPLNAEEWMALKSELD